MLQLITKFTLIIKSSFTENDALVFKYRCKYAGMTTEGSYLILCGCYMNIDADCPDMESSETMLHPTDIRNMKAVKQGLYSRTTVHKYSSRYSDSLVLYVLYSRS